MEQCEKRFSLVPLSVLTAPIHNLFFKIVNEPIISSQSQTFIVAYICNTMVSMLIGTKHNRFK